MVNYERYVAAQEIVFKKFDYVNNKVPKAS